MLPRDRFSGDGCCDCAAENGVWTLLKAGGGVLAARACAAAAAVAQCCTRHEDGKSATHHCDVVLTLRCVLAQD